MDINQMVQNLSQAFAREINIGMQQGMSTNDLSIAQVIVAKIILVDPMNKDNLDAKITFTEPGREN